MDFEILNNKIKLFPKFQENNVEGSNLITIRPLKLISKISLNSKGIKIISIESQLVGVNIIEKYELNDEKEKIYISFNISLEKVFIIQINFTSNISNSFEGFYKSNIDENDSKNFWLVTHFFETHARKAIPCFDNPKMKSTFDLELIIDKNLHAIFNTEIINESVIDQEKKSISFATTPKMSTYLLFIGVGKFDRIQKEILNKNIRIIAETPNAKINGEFALECAIRAFQYCQNYFMYPYPISKLDFIAVRKSQFGAMENWGAITFKENSLLHYQTTSYSQEYSIQTTISHEIVHQWFGNLVSPADFKYLWLNESFATYFGYKTVNNLYPEQNVWERFLSKTNSTALYRDAFKSTVPIELSNGEEFSLNYLSSPIIYNKGGSILRQLENFIGEKSFNNGLRHYLEKFAFSVATSDDLWQSLEETSNFPIVKLMKGWTYQKGYPVLNINDNGKEITISQEKFLYLGEKSEQIWYVPINLEIWYTNGEKETQTILMKEQVIAIKLESELEFLIVNSNAFGYYRVFYSKKNFNFLLNLLPELSTISKWVIENDYFAFLQSGKSTLTDYLSIIKRLTNENSLLIVESILEHFNYLKIILKQNTFSKIKSIGKDFCQSVIESIGLIPIREESAETSELRGIILNSALQFDIEKAIDFGLKNYKKIKSNTYVNVNLIESSLIIGTSIYQDFEWLKNSYLTTNKEEDRLKYIKAMGIISNSDTIQEVYSFALEKLPLRHLTNFISDVTQNPRFNADLLYWYEENIDHFELLPKASQQECFHRITTRSLINFSKLQIFLGSYQKKHQYIANIIPNVEETLLLNKSLREKIEIEEINLVK